MAACLTHYEFGRGLDAEATRARLRDPGSELKVEYVRLRYPTIADNSQPGELKDHVDKAIRVLEAYLEKNSKE
ncbi:hypothetical protein [Arthrobacter sp. 2MCAF14]|uniref:hypothetical protein n=1 Tax=Arthrobacter sp. 2MCAF14 TaxID=3232982 RepID=UPI003F8E044A